MSEKVNNSVAQIVRGVVANKKAILAIPTEPEKKDTIEFVIDEQKTRILVHSQGITIKAKSTPNNLELGLKPLSSNPDFCRIILSHSEVEKAKDIISELDC